ncbi:Rubber elongation factor [Macleaya cordata]|uniref:Rubber elongation factor n=1 Tax=Macleaya cordata TaxID=56857 RepID=A0A200QWL4_MACCD|nr:Rubber elongation factor [Macleaya cordata]
MAEIESKQQQPEMCQSDEERLKYLEFVQVATLHAVVYLSKIYNLAKENSGPLKPGVESVEGTVKTVVSPVYEKFQDVPYELLKFVDHKVDKSMSELEQHVPPLVKEVSGQAYSAAQMAPKMAQAVAFEVQRAGLVETATKIAKTVYTKVEPTAKEVYAKYEPVAEQHAATAWRKLNQLPLFPQVANVVVPAAASWSDKYNRAVSYTAERGYTVSSYLPLVPKERIAKVFGGANCELEQPLLVTSCGADAAH